MMLSALHLSGCPAFWTTDLSCTCGASSSRTPTQAIFDRLRFGTKDEQIASLEALMGMVKSDRAYVQGSLPGSGKCELLIAEKSS
jgi:hypothetical protein